MLDVVATKITTITAITTTKTTTTTTTARTTTAAFSLPFPGVGDRRDDV